MRWAWSPVKAVRRGQPYFHGARLKPTKPYVGVPLSPTAVHHVSTWPKALLCRLHRRCSARPVEAVAALRGVLCDLDGVIYEYGSQEVWIRLHIEASDMQLVPAVAA